MGMPLWCFGQICLLFGIIKEMCLYSGIFYNELCMSYSTCICDFTNIKPFESQHMEKN